MRATEGEREREREREEEIERARARAHARTHMRTSYTNRTVSENRLRNSIKGKSLIKISKVFLNVSIHRLLSAN